MIENYLSLFAGAEGGGLAFQHLLQPKFNCIGYVENDDYCQRVIRQRQIDGLLDKAPIYGDIRTFIDSGCAALYQGLADVVTAGFPCQPFSVAGKRKGEQDERNMWPWTIAAIRLVRPRYAFLENVPGLLASGYMPRIFADLAEAGYHARWTVLGADDLGAWHRRKRLWILAYSNKLRLETYRHNRSGKKIYSVGLPMQNNGFCSRDVWWAAITDIHRNTNGMAHRVDRFKAIGNGQVPQVATLAWEILKT